MEGILTRVSAGRDKLKQRWCHLSSNGIMTLYRCSSDDSSHDVNLKSVKGRISLMNCSITITDEPSFQFEIRHPEVEKVVCFRAPDEDSLSRWIEALRAAEKYAVPLGQADAADEPPLNAEKAPLSSSKKSAQNFEVVMQKSGGKGFGIVIESTSDGVIVKDKSDACNILSIIPESVGSLQVGDRLLKINDQDVHDWSIASIIEFIADDRIPALSTARFSFLRRNRPTLTAKRSFHLEMFSRNNSAREIVTPREAAPSPRELFAQYNVLECGMCTENFEEDGDLCPHVLSCGHSFCHKDLKSLLLVVSDTFRCPTCLRKSKLSQYDEGFPPKNFSMLEALRFEYCSKDGGAADSLGVDPTLPEEGGCSGCGEEDLLVHCFDCNADFCSKCNITIHQPVKFKAHRRGAVEAREVVNTLCRVHNEKLKVYCFSPTCNTPICVLCTTIGTHKSHDFRPIQDVFVAEKADFKVKLAEESELLYDLKDYKRDKSAELDTLSQNMVRAASVIREDFRAARRRLEELEEKAIDSLNQHASSRTLPLKADIEKIGRCINSSISKQNSQLLFASSLRFMSQLAEAEQQMKNTRLEATALLTRFRAQEVEYPTDVCIVGRDDKGIEFSNTEYSFASYPDKRNVDPRRSGGRPSRYTLSTTQKGSQSSNFSSNSFDECSAEFS